MPAKTHRLETVKGVSGPASGHVQDGIVHVERWFKASPERVFKAWSDPKLLPRFFWPVGTGKVDKLDFRVGGQLLMSHLTEPWTATWTFVEIVPNRKIVTRDPFPDGSGRFSTGTMDFLAKDGGCLLRIVDGPFPDTWGPTEGAALGFKMAVDRLAEELETPAQGEGFRLVRYFNAPRSQVYRMWTTKEGLLRWWALGAKDIGYDFRVAKLDVRAGGEYDLVMSNAQQGELHNHGRYVEVVPDERIVQEWQFDIFLAPGEKPYPISVRVEFEDVPTIQGTTGTKMTFTQGPMASPEFTEGSRQGIINNFSKLEAALDPAKTATRA